MSGKKLGLAARLSLSFALPLALLVIISGLSLWALHSMQAGLKTVYLDRVVPLEGLKRIADMYAVNVIDAVNKANAGLFDAGKTRDEVAMAQQVISREWQSYLQTELTSEEQQLVGQAKQLFEVADADIAQLSSFLQGKQGQLTGQMTDFDGVLYRSIDPISAKVTELVELQLRVAKQEFESAELLYDHLLWWIIALAIVAFVGSAWAAYAVVRNTLWHLAGEPEYVAGLVRRVAAGELAIGLQPDPHNQHSVLTNLALMIGQLRTIMLELKQSTDAIEQSSQELAVSSEQSTQQLIAQ